MPEIIECPHLPGEHLAAMCALFLYSVALVYIPAGAVIKKMDQIPADAIKAAGDVLSMSCNHSGKRGLYMIWYKQTSLAAAFAQVARTGSKNVVEDRDVYRLTGGAARSSLGVTHLHPSENGAVYFCAATEAHTALRDLIGPATKTASVGFRHRCMCSRANFAVCCSRPPVISL